MGKLLTGHYGEAPEAESMAFSLTDCHQRLGLKPSDFVSEGPPDFFNKNYGAKGRYLIFQTDTDEIASNPAWRSGYYLLPIEAADVLEALAKRRLGGTAERHLPIQLEAKVMPPEAIVAKAQQWAEASQPLFFKCKCDHLELRMDAPWAMRRRWRARLRCPSRCQPPLTVLL